MTYTKAATAFALAFSCALAAHAQSTDCSKLPTYRATQECAREHSQIQVIPLKNITSQNQANEILVALRNTFDPSDKMYLDADRNAIVVNSYPEENARMAALVRQLDTPHKTYRLNYTFTDSDSGKRLGTQHFSLLAIPGHMTILKVGDKIPVATGSYRPDAPASSSTQTQFTYLDVGINLQATLMSVEQGADLKYKVDQSSVSEKPSGFGTHDPVIHQTSLSGDTILPPGKPMMLGSADVPGSSHHIDIEVVMEAVQ